MKGPRFTIDGLAIEGFKAFGPKQEIGIAGKHLFLFGQNARGKSSIVEAIRWSLFGSERDSDVRNRFDEATDCRVELRLRDETGVWRVERQLRPGNVRSDQFIYQPDGTETTQRDTLPNLMRLGSSAGAVVFFSTQQASRVRSFGDLTRFHEVLYAHLGLNDADALRSGLQTLLEEQFQIQQQRSDEVQKVEDRVRTRLGTIATSLGELMQLAPWDQQDPPTSAETAARIAGFLADVAREVGGTIAQGLSPEAALTQADVWIREFAEGRKGALSTSTTSTKAERARFASKLSEIRAAIDAETAEREVLRSLELQMQALTGDKTIEEGKVEREALRTHMGAQGHWIVARKALLEIVGPVAKTCPICEREAETLGLVEKLTNGVAMAESATKQEADKLQKLESLIGSGMKLEASISSSLTKADALANKHSQAKEGLAGELGCQAEDSLRIGDARLKELDERIMVLIQEGTGAATHASNLSKRSKALRSELHYHQLREEEQRLIQKLDADLAPLRDRLRAFEEFRSTVQAIQGVLAGEFDAEVDRALPTVSEQMTDTFRRLTDHPAFDVVRVLRAEGPDKLVVRVGSTRAPVPMSRPEDVLNGGAYAALGLVPHFVFSDVHAEQSELNLLIVDDPSQSFDTAHVELLLEELARASRNAQLVLATHEEERFLPILQKHFKPDSYALVRVTGFKPGHGPTLQVA
jgi:DNA repair exonuclease SbcCD ATPase subunit